MTLAAELVQRRQVVENPERPALRGDHQILVRDLDIGNGRHGQVQLEGLPVAAVIERNVHAEFGSGVEQAGAVGIFAHHAGGLVGGDAVRAVGEPGPGLAEIVGAVNVGREIAQQVTVDGDIGGARPERAGLDVLHASAGRQACGSDIGPGLAIVARHVDQAIVRAGPDEPFCIGDSRMA